MAYFIFFGIFSLLLCLYFYDERFRSASSWMFFALLTAYSGIRYGTGRDYYLYREAYINPTGEFAANFEPLWQFINQTLLSWGLDFRVWLFLTAGVTYLIMFSAFKRMSLNLGLSILCFVIVFQGYFESMNAVRQYVAIAIAFWAYPLLMKKQYWWFLLSCLIAAQFHSSAYFALILLPLSLVNLKRNTLLILLVGTFIFGNFLLGIILDLAFPLLPVRYSQYIVKIYATVVQTGLLKIFFNLLAATLVIIGYPISLQHKEIRYYLTLFTMAICIFNLTLNFEVAMRLMYYPFVFLFVLIPNIFQLAKERMVKIVVLLMLIGLAVFMFKGISDPKEPYAVFETMFTPKYKV